MENPITPNPENNLFEVCLSAESAVLFNRVFRLARWLFLLGIFMSIIQLANIGIRFRMYNPPRSLQDGGLILILTSIYPIFEILMVVLTVTQLYFFFNFTRVGNKGIELQQSELFNESFKWLLRETRLALILFVVETLLLVFAMYSNYRVFVKMH
ncbi:hypothetical protein A4D02_22615 [Niastella koreensis]|uniref:Uncharacterized protein n=2 Tax=Niastella koreensis TaxID=354356 RepID=G8TEE5_NIAKG|nr:hypothetical protein [Niastella koreensis]AEV98355.1 hypothetical protein Niako_2000 [Niastella koreensis GR20-10]OQP53191.1 hypothetical protein A4D02_22615 [Niastella koreensis]